MKKLLDAQRAAAPRCPVHTDTPLICPRCRAGRATRCALCGARTTRAHLYDSPADVLCARCDRGRVATEAEAADTTTTTKGPRRRPR